MDFDQLRRDLQWLRGEDGVVKPAVAEEVLVRILEPLLPLSKDSIGSREQAKRVPTASIFRRLAVSRNPRPKTIGIQYKHFGRGDLLVSKPCARCLVLASSHRTTA